jgi:hypothetical protein
VVFVWVGQRKAGQGRARDDMVDGGFVGSEHA